MGQYAPTSQVKRKHNFELVITIPAKRFKALNHPTSNLPSNPPATSSSRTVPETSLVVVATRGPAKNAQNHLSSGSIIRKVSGATFEVDLDPEIRGIAVTRDFMWTHFGVNPSRSFSQIPNAQFKKHGYDHFVFVRGVRMTKLIPFTSPQLVEIHQFT